MSVTRRSVRICFEDGGSKNQYPGDVSSEQYKVQLVMIDWSECMYSSFMQFTSWEVVKLWEQLDLLQLTQRYDFLAESTSAVSRGDLTCPPHTTNEVWNPSREEVRCHPCSLLHSHCCSSLTLLYVVLTETPPSKNVEGWDRWTWCIDAN